MYMYIFARHNVLHKIVFTGKMWFTSRNRILLWIIQKRRDWTSISTESKLNKPKRTFCFKGSILRAVRRCCPSEQTYSRSTNYSPQEFTSGPYCTIRRSRRPGIGSYCCSWCTPPYSPRTSLPSFCRIRITTAERTRSTAMIPSS